MDTTIGQSFTKAISYAEYRTILAQLLLEGKSSGNEQSEDLLHYSKLNETRMNRLEKTIVIDTQNIENFNNLKHHYYWLVLAEGWCGDAAQLLPIFYKIAEASNKIEMKILFRDENETLMNMFLTNGAKAIPKIIILEKETLEVKGTWGPRPKTAANLIINYKALHGVVDETAKIELQMWYLNDKGMSTQNELISLMTEIEK